MPKENKKFINPLLRPSQEMEVARQEASTTPKPAPAPATPEPPVPASAQITQAETPVMEEPTLKQIEDAFSVDDEDEAEAEPMSAFADQEDMPEQRVPRMQSSYYGSPAREVPLPHVYNGNRRNAQAAQETGNSISALRNNTTSLPGRSNDAPVPQVTRAVLPNPKNTSYTYTPTEASSYPDRYTSGDRPAQRPQEHEPVVEQQPPARAGYEEFSFIASQNARRKRGAQAFENTHERITLWIDKRLKQAFEDLAFEHELPKTALLNEAIADLLKKYNS